MRALQQGDEELKDDTPPREVVRDVNEDGEVQMWQMTKARSGSGFHPLEPSLGNRRRNFSLADTRPKLWEVVCCVGSFRYARPLL